MAAHSSYGFSGQSRVIACPGSVGMQTGLPNSSNPASELGTSVHEVGEFSLHMGINAHHLIGMTFNGIKVNEDMAFAAQVHVDYVRSIMAERPNAKLYIEGKLILSSIDLERLWGTGDIIIVDGDTLFVIDYKNGYGLVEIDSPQYVYATNTYINGNAQVVGYAIAAMDTYGLWDTVTKIITGVVQPNVDHIDGCIRTKEYTVPQLQEWWQVYAKSHTLAIQPNAPRNAGGHCRYCLAEGHCSTRLKFVMETLMLDTAINNCTADQLLAIYNEAAGIRKTLEAIESRMIQIARTGKKIPGRKLVKSIVHAKLTNEDDLISEYINSVIVKKSTLPDGTNVVLDDADLEYIKNTELPKLYNKKIKGKTDIKKIVGDEIANKFYITPKAGVTLVGMSDKRPAVMADNKPSAKGVFGEI